jgi:phytoene desaturase
MSKKVLITGSGLGALATALRLTTKGYKDITVLEKYHQPGGRLNQLKSDGFTFDMGPSFFSMSYEFKELFEACGMKDPLEYQKLDPLYTVNFSNGKRYNIFTDLDKLATEFEAVEPNFKAKVEKYLNNARAIFHDTENIVIKQNFDGKLHYLLQLTRVPWKHAPRMFYSMWKDLENSFESNEVKVIFSLVAFFLGATPFETPAVYKLLNYTELQHDGYWNVKGGMYRIVEELVAELHKRGVKFEYNTEVVECITDGKKVTAIKDNNGVEHKADIFVVNADAASFRGKILKRARYNEERLDAMDWTLAPFTIYLGVKGKIDGLNHHNYFLGDNFKEYADDIFKLSVNPDKPYYYVNVSSKSNVDCAPEGCENLFILCPVPDLRYKKSWDDAEELSETIIDDLGKRVGYDIANNIMTKIILSPTEWQNSLNLYRGSGLGLAHGLNQIGGFRPANKDEELSNLYYVGASTTPGTGLPIVVISSRLVTERIFEEA